MCDDFLRELLQQMGDLLQNQTKIGVFQMLQYFSIYFPYHEKKMCCKRTLLSNDTRVGDDGSLTPSA
jgi:hypothetical protein